MEQKPKRKKKQDKVFAMRLRPDYMKAIQELADQEHRTVSNMGQVLIFESLKARGVEL